MGDRDRGDAHRAGCQQCAPPQEVYDSPDQPVRRGVHRLAGDEPLPGRAGRAGGDRAARPPDARPARPRCATSASTAPTAAPVVVGIRPEQLADAARGPARRRQPAARGHRRPGRGARLGEARPLPHRRRAAQRDRRPARGGRGRGARDARGRRDRRRDRDRRRRARRRRRAASPPTSGSFSPSTPRRSTCSTPRPASRCGTPRRALSEARLTRRASGPADSIGCALRDALCHPQRVQIALRRGLRWRA